MLEIFKKNNYINIVNVFMFIIISSNSFIGDEGGVSINNLMKEGKHIGPDQIASSGTVIWGILFTHGSLSEIFRL